jgi:hypothetical protein
MVYLTIGAIGFDYEIHLGDPTPEVVAEYILGCMSGMGILPQQR